MELLYAPLGPYQTNCYILAHEGKAVVIDPGMGAKDLVSRLAAEHELTVEQIVLTHGHIDHTRDAGEISARWGAPMWLHPDDFIMVEQPGVGVSAETARAFDADHMAPLSDLQSLEHGQELNLLGLRFHVRHAPGHSPGSVLLVGDDIVFSGDVLFQGSIGRTDLPGSSPADMVTSLRDQVLTLDDSLAVLPGHGPRTTMRQERRSNPFLNNLDSIA